MLEVDRCGTLNISESRQAWLIVSEAESLRADQTVELKSYFLGLFKINFIFRNF